MAPAFGRSQGKIVEAEILMDVSAGAIRGRKVVPWGWAEPQHWEDKTHLSVQPQVTGEIINPTQCQQEFRNGVKKLLLQQGKRCWESLEEISSQNT